MIILGRAHEARHAGDPQDHHRREGAHTAHGLTEWYASLAFQLGAGLELAERGLEVELMGGTTAGRILHTRDPLKPCSCIIEPHFNALEGAPARGYFALVKHDDPKSQRLALCILAEMAVLPIPRHLAGLCLCDETRRWIGQGYEYTGKRLGLLLDTGCPAVIIETCHATDPKDTEWLASWTNRVQAGRAIGRGIAAWLEKGG